MPGKNAKKDPGRVQKWSEVEWGYATLHLGRLRRRFSADKDTPSRRAPPAWAEGLHLPFPLARRPRRDPREGTGATRGWGLLGGWKHGGWGILKTLFPSTFKFVDNTSVTANRNLHSDPPTYTSPRILPCLK